MVRDYFLGFIAASFFIIWITMDACHIQRDIHSIDTSLKIIAEYYKDGNPADSVRALEGGE